MPHSPPVPIAARFFAGALILEVDFDRLLQPGPLDPGNWTLRANNTRHGLGPPTAAAGNRVTGTVIAGLPNMGPDVVDYQPPPFDVLSSFGIPAAAFADFPLTFLP